MSNNQADVQGNQNIVIQGVSLSKIEITQHLDPKSFAQELQKYFQNKKHISVVVLSIRPEKIKTVLETNKLAFSFVEIAEHYGTEYKDWKPYLLENQLVQLLKEYQEDSGFEISVFFVDNLNPIADQTFLDKLKWRMKEIVWIIDTFALLSEGNQHLIDKFDHAQIGACLIPLTTSQLKPTIYQSVQQLIKTHLKTLHNFINSYADFVVEQIDTGLIHIDLEIKDKHTLFRRLTAIATLGKIERVALSAFGNYTNPNRL